MSSKRLTTPEQDEYIAQHIHMKSYVEIQAMLKNDLGIEFTIDQVKGYLGRKHLNTGRTGRFEPGHVPANKGKPMTKEQYEKCKATMFKKGSIPPSHRPVGSERIEADGYIKIKVKEGLRGWRYKHRIVWEQHNGPIPKGYKITFLDKNKLNCNIENLAMITSEEMARINQSNLFSDNQDVSKVGLVMAKLLVAKGRAKRRFKKGEKQ